MEGEFFTAKLNLSPKIIQIYTNSDKNSSGMEQLKKTVIVNSLKKIFTYEEVVGKNKNIQKYSCLQIDEKKEIINSDVYIKFKNAKTNLLNGYESVIESSHENKGIFWPNEYLHELKPKMKQCLYELKDAYPILNQVVVNTKDDDVKKNLPGNGNFGHGRKYLLDSEKIEGYLLNSESVIDFNRNYFFYYNNDNERLFISIKYGEEIFKRIILDIQEKINGSNSDIGKINIIPIYNALKVENSYKNVTFEVVYPNNPHRTKSINRVLDKPFEKSEATQIDVKLHSDGSSDNHKFSATMINELADIFFGSKFGYLKSIKSDRRNITNGEIKRTFIDQNNDDEGDE
ncbi:hypothetical protein [Liquorilactobacillus hordei]|uniref:Uncharacterized protein n=1 Tax=Liquorilactobacillus hordei TaxID=468911 RepID=A0A3S6QNT0_9LACO|nr:hypothetical protein [Liquorilactobacillus hordei]AUJ29613.1 hypothetical protein BSQ49_05005 [Liquorilactobacillus hordei]